MTDISYETSWDCTIALENWLSPNSYQCRIDFDINTDIGDFQNIAFERCKIILESVFENSLFINVENPLMPTFAKKTKQQIVSLPNEPLDVIVSSVVFRKLNAVTEQKLLINKITLSSSQGENVWIHYDDEFDQVFNLESQLFSQTKETPWWLRNDASVSDWFEIGKKESKFHKHVAKWEESLLWENKAEKNLINKWKPTVIDGGKTKH